MNRLLSIILLLFIAVVGGTANAQTFQEMQAAWERKDFSTAFTGFLKLAEQNDPEAQARVASMYISGQGVAKDEKRGHEWAEKSAINASPQGQFVLGLNYMLGRGTSRDESNAAYWFEKAINGGHPFAHSNLAFLYRRGLGVKQDYQKALGILQAGVAVNDSRNLGSHVMLAEMFEKGEGTPVNRTEALRLLNIVKQKAPSNSTFANNIQKSIERIESLSAVSTNTTSLATAGTMLNSAGISGNTSVRVMPAADPKKECEAQLKTDSRLAGISSKISLTGASDISFTMLADQTYPTQIEQKLIALYADAIRKCAGEAEPIRKQKYPSDINTAFMQSDASFTEAAIELYNKKITYGKFNAKVQQLDRDLAEKLTLFAQQASVQKNQLDEANRARTEAMRDAQRRQDQARQAEEQRAQQQRQAEQERINANRSRWVARCNLDKANAFAEGKVRYKEECDSTYRNASNTAINRLGVMACVMSIDKQAEEYAKVTFDACMSGAP